MEFEDAFSFEDACLMEGLTCILYVKKNNACVCKYYYFQLLIFFCLLSHYHLIEQ